MANEEHLAKLLEGVEAWNAWREANPEIRPDLSEANFSKAILAGGNFEETNLEKTNLSEANLRGANLTGAYLGRAKLRRADLSEANLRGANLFFTNLIMANLREANLTKADLFQARFFKATLHGANLSKAHIREADLAEADLTAATLSKANLREADLTAATLSKANLREADLPGAVLFTATLRETNLTGANLRYSNLHAANLEEADLSRADLRFASLVRTSLDSARLDGCKVFGVSAWRVSLIGASQRDLVVTDSWEDPITVDNLRLAQFIYMLLRNPEIREIIDTITSKVVLILGRFTEERKKVLDALRNELRKRNYTPVLFDFEKPESRDLTETIITLASMARFVIADISAAKSIPQELSHIIPNLPSVPIQPVLLASDREFAMFEHWRRYDWVLPDFLYEDEAHLLASLSDKVIGPAEQKRLEQTGA